MSTPSSTVRDWSYVIQSSRNWLWRQSDGSLEGYVVTRVGLVRVDAMQEGTTLLEFAHDGRIYERRIKQPLKTRRALTRQAARWARSIVEGR